MRRIDQVTAAKGVPMAEVIRRALDEYLDEELDAATALEHGLSLVTRNRKDFTKVRGLRIRAL